MVMDNIEQVGPRLATRSSSNATPNGRMLPTSCARSTWRLPSSLPPPCIPRHQLPAPGTTLYVIAKSRALGPSGVDRAESRASSRHRRPGKGRPPSSRLRPQLRPAPTRELRCEQSVALDPSTLPADGRLRIPVSQPLRTASRSRAFPAHRNLAGLRRSAGSACAPCRSPIPRDTARLLALPLLPHEAANSL